MTTWLNLYLVKWPLMAGLVARGDPTVRRGLRWDLGADKLGKGQRWAEGEVVLQRQREGLLGAKLGLDKISLHLENTEPDLINGTCWRAGRGQ